MSTNYYFVDIASNLVAKKHNAQVEVIFNQAKASLEQVGYPKGYIEQKTLNWEDAFTKTRSKIHIGKRSAGWKPLFQTSSNYAGVQEMKKWYKEKQMKYVIEDEYGEVLTWAQLESELMTWDGKKSHVETMRNDYPSMADDYFVVDGYEFTTREFS